MIAETQNDILVQAISMAALNDRLSFFNLTVNDVSCLAEIMAEVMKKNGFYMRKSFTATQYINNQTICTIE